ncbi:MAG TPA: substrate-binding domain-containing protein [Streptosporangiaceae bacterium]|nr:substrate-binding domain-containing protein [Streptosporangiaceae bacterium]
MAKVDPKVDEAIQTLNMKDGPARRTLLSGAGLVSATAAASALLAACGSTASPAHAATAAGNFPKVPAWKFWFVNHVTTNPFFVPTQYGLQDAAALLHIPTPNWGGSTNSIASDMVNYMNTATASGAAGIALAVISQTAFTEPVANAMDKGIPVVSYNADGTYVKGQPVIGTNRLCYVGQALYLSGQSMGEQIKSLIPGGGDVAIFIATPGTGNIQPRYDGAVSVLGSSYTVHEVATGAATSVELNAEKAYLLANKSTLKGAFAVDYGSTSFLGSALASTGLTGKIASGGFDTAPQTLSALQGGTMDFTIYQDPYLQGFLPVLYMYLYNLSDAQLPPPDTDTGLSVIDKEHIGQFVKSSRFQGAASAQKYLPRPSGPIKQPMAVTST